MARTDIHRPSSPDFDPASYRLLGIYDLHPEEGSRDARARRVAQAVALGWSFANAPHPSGQCGHCGAYLRYAALAAPGWAPDGLTDAEADAYRRGARAGMAHLLEAVLHETGNYRGFGYLAAPVDWRDPTGRHAGPRDETRRWYY